MDVKLGMSSYQRQLAAITSITFAILMLLLLILQHLQAKQAIAVRPPQASSTALVDSSSNAAPIIGRQVVLYNPALNSGTLADQGFTYSDLLGSGAETSFVITDSVTVLDTSAVESDLAGYGLVNALNLDASRGYMLRFAARVVSENHSSSDRAGFSVTTLGNNTRGVELGFWEDEIWVQEGGSPPTLFTHAEGASIDTTGGQAGLMTQYQLSILTDTYFLSAAPIPTENTLVEAATILSGTVRDYTAFSGFPDVYETANFLFLGDNTSRGQAQVNIGMISAIVAEPPASRTITSGSSINIDDLGIIVQSSDVVTLSFATEGGSLQVDTSIAGGVTSDGLRSVSSTVVNVPDLALLSGFDMILVADVNAINTTLAHPGGLIYRGPNTTSGTDTITITVADGNQIGQQTIDVTINPANSPAETSTPMPTESPTATPTTTPMPGSVQVPPPQTIYLPVVVK